MYSSAFSDTDTAVEESYGVTRRGLPPALDGVFPLLLAITCDAHAAPAISVTRALARTHGAIPTVLRALGSDHETEILIPPFAGYVAEGALSPEYRDESRKLLQQQVTDVAGAVRWRFEIADESPVRAIVNQAQLLRVGLIVIGLRQRGMVHRVLTGNLLRSVVRQAGVPVLAVRADLVDLPRRVVVAVDFGEASIHAASLARHILADDGELHLVHVVPDTERQDSSSARMTAGGIASRATSALASMIDDLRPGPRMTITSHVIEGEREAAIDGFAERVRADLLAVGSDEHPLFDRLVHRSVSMGLATRAHRSMLVVPARSHTHDQTATGERSVTQGA